MPCMDHYAPTPTASQSQPRAITFLEYARPRPSSDGGPPWQLATIAQLTYYCVGSMKELFLLVDRHTQWTHTPFSTFVSANAPRLYRSWAFPKFPAVDSAVLFLSLTVLSFKRNFLENLSRCQTSLAKPSHIADVNLINKRRRWAWLHRTPLHRLLVGAHKS
jgi:hypothetical protein